MEIKQIEKAFTDSKLFFDNRYKTLLPAADFKRYKTNYSKGLRKKLDNLKKSKNKKQLLEKIYKYDQRFYVAIDKTLDKKVKIRKYKYFEPYFQDGKARFNDINEKSGVYVIKEIKPGEKGKIVYIGFSGTNLYKTMYRHFQSWVDKTQVRITYQHRMKKNKYMVRIVLCSPERAAKLEKALILDQRPRDNEMKYEAYTLDNESKDLFSEFKTVETRNDEPF